MDIYKTINVKILKCGLRYNGDLSLIELSIEGQSFAYRTTFENGTLTGRDFDELFKVFDICPNNGVYLHEIEGKVCRLVTNKDTRDIIGLQHIIEDHYVFAFKR